MHRCFAGDDMLALTLIVFIICFALVSTQISCQLLNFNRKR